LGLTALGLALAAGVVLTVWTLGGGLVHSPQAKEELDPGPLAQKAGEEPATGTAQAKDKLDLPGHTGEGAKKPASVLRVPGSIRGLQPRR
jgi:hypothetical protein